MSYQRLIAEHDAILASAAVLLRLADAGAPRPFHVARALGALARLLREHLDGEYETIYRTILRAQNGRHAATAQRMGAQLDTLKEAWESYLYRWDLAHITANWSGFVDDTIAMLDRVHESIAFETLVLYSLALHLDIITID